MMNEFRSRNKEDPRRHLERYERLQSMGILCLTGALLNGVGYFFSNHAQAETLYDQGGIIVLLATACKAIEPSVPSIQQVIDMVRRHRTPKMS